jgi:hypothetical protein
MHKPKKPLVLKTDRVKVLTSTDLGKVEGGTGGRTIPPKLNTVRAEM